MSRLKHPCLGTMLSGCYTEVACIIIEVGGALGLHKWMDFGTYPTGWYIEGDLQNQVAVSTGSTALYYTVEN